MAKNMRAHVLATASKAVNGQRNVSYGEPEDNFGRIARFLNAFMLGRFGLDAPQFEPHDVATIGRLFKEGRLAGNPQHLDSLIDIAGYAACGAEVAKAK